MVRLDQKMRPHPEVVDTEFESGEGVLLHLESKTYYSLNLTGMRIWRGLKQGLTLKEISHNLQTEFEVDEERAESSVLTVVGELSQQNLLQTPE
ncbi:MAG: PqqD family protein [Nitrospirae bacterium]|nr:PqqD family protein [Nitrospirota bacterium]